MLFYFVLSRSSYYTKAEKDILTAKSLVLRDRHFLVFGMKMGTSNVEEKLRPDAGGIWGGYIEHFGVELTNCSSVFFFWFFFGFLIFCFWLK
jgi:hypothetical protein